MSALIALFALALIGAGAWFVLTMFALGDEFDSRREAFDKMDATQDRIIEADALSANEVSRG